MNKTGSDAVVVCAEWGISPITSEALPSIHRQAKAVKEDRPPLLCKKVNNAFAIPSGQIIAKLTFVTRKCATPACSSHDSTIFLINLDRPRAH